MLLSESGALQAFLQRVKLEALTDLAGHERDTALVQMRRIKMLLLISQLITLLRSAVTSSIKTSESFPLAAIHNKRPCYMIHPIFKVNPVN